MTQKHTPGPHRKPDPNYNCDCEAMGGLILFCNMHKAAPDLLGVLENLCATVREVKQHPSL